MVWGLKLCLWKDFLNMDAQQPNAEDFKKEVLQNNSMQEYFKQFEKHSVENFIDSYCQDKVYWTMWGDRNLNDEESHSIKWETDAFEHLSIIQQKKLFDIQCLWRAEKLEIKEIEICFDFEMWENDILNCPFIEPINEDDIELYIAFLQSSYGLEDAIEQSFWLHQEIWQNYDELKMAYNDESDASYNFPEWYDFHNQRRGTGIYITLPNIRGEKEDFYTNLTYMANSIEYEKNNLEAVIENNKPKNYLWYSDNEKLEWFVKTFDSKKVYEYYKAYQWSRRNDGKEEDLRYYLSILLNAEEPIAMIADTDWAMGLTKTALTYKNKKIAEALPIAWEQYMLNVQMNIAFDSTRPFSKEDETRLCFVENILKGRKLNGEEENFDF